MKVRTVLELAIGLVAIFIGLDIGSWIAGKLRI